MICVQLRFSLSFSMPPVQISDHHVAIDHFFAIEPQHHAQQYHDSARMLRWRPMVITSSFVSNIAP